MKYIAYGSNMVQEQMAFRCPDAKLIGMGYLEGARLEFYLHATVERTGKKRNRVPVAVWEISRADEISLDRYEGVAGGYYTKETFLLTMNRVLPTCCRKRCQNFFTNLLPVPKDFY